MKASINKGKLIPFDKKIIVIVDIAASAMKKTTANSYVIFGQIVMI